MKLYYHRSIEGLSNAYIVVNPESREALIIDPGKITTTMIEQIECDNYNLTSVLITHNHKSHTQGIATLTKIYSPQIYAADSEIINSDMIVLKGDGLLKVASLTVGYISIPGHTPDSMAYKIGNCLFTGDALFAGRIGSTTSAYARKLLVTNIQTKILSQHDSIILMPGHGPPSTIAAEKKFNIELGCPVLHTPKDLPAHMRARNTLRFF